MGESRKTPCASGGTATTSAAIPAITATLAQALEPFPQYGSINGTTKGGHSTYNALETQLQHTFAGGFWLQLSVAALTVLTVVITLVAWLWPRVGLLRRPRLETQREPKWTR